MVSPSAVAVIPARFASTRFPGKLLQPLHGRSVLSLVHDRARRIPGLDRIIVATDDERIAREARRFGGEAVMTSPLHASGTDRIGEVVNALDPPPELVLNLQGDEPLFLPSAVGRLLEDLRRDPGSIWTMADPIDDPDELRRPSAVKVVCAADGRALYFSRSPIPFDRRSPGGLPEPGVALRHVGVYGYSVDRLRLWLALPPSPLEVREGLEQLRALEAGLTIRVRVGAWPDAGVDTPEDLERLRRRYPTWQALERAPLEDRSDEGGTRTAGGDGESAAR